VTGRQKEEIERLFQRYGAGVGSYVLARTGDPELAEEITSRVFVKVVQRYDQCTHSPAGWLWSIVRTEILHQFRDRKATVESEFEPADHRPTPPERALAGEMQQHMREALAQLPIEKQQLIFMKFFQDMSNQEIAEATGMTPSNVGVSVFRALAELRALMEPAGKGTE